MALSPVARAMAQSFIVSGQKVPSPSTLTRPGELTFGRGGEETRVIELPSGTPRGTGSSMFASGSFGGGSSSPLAIARSQASAAGAFFSGKSGKPFKGNIRDLATGRVVSVSSGKGQELLAAHNARTAAAKQSFAQAALKARNIIAATASGERIKAESLLQNASTEVKRIVSASKKQTTPIIGGVASFKTSSLRGGSLVGGLSTPSKTSRASIDLAITPSKPKIRFKAIPTAAEGKSLEAEGKSLREQPLKENLVSGGGGASLSTQRKIRAFNAKLDLFNKRVEMTQAIQGKSGVSFIDPSDIKGKASKPKQTTVTIGGKQVPVSPFAGVVDFGDNRITPTSPIDVKAMQGFTISAEGAERVRQQQLGIGAAVAGGLLFPGIPIATGVSLPIIAGGVVGGGLGAAGFSAAAEPFISSMKPGPVTEFTKTDTPPSFDIPTTIRPPKQTLSDFEIFPTKTTRTQTPTELEETKGFARLGASTLGFVVGGSIGAGLVGSIQKALITTPKITITSNPNSGPVGNIKVTKLVNGKPTRATFSAPTGFKFLKNGKVVTVTNKGIVVTVKDTVKLLTQPKMLPKPSTPSSFSTSLVPTSSGVATLSLVKTPSLITTASVGGFGLTFGKDVSFKTSKFLGTPKRPLTGFEALESVGKGPLFDTPFVFTEGRARGKLTFKKQPTPTQPFTKDFFKKRKGLFEEIETKKRAEGLSRVEKKTIAKEFRKKEIEALKLKFGTVPKKSSAAARKAELFKGLELEAKIRAEIRGKVDFQKVLGLPTPARNIFKIRTKGFFSEIAKEQKAQAIKRKEFGVGFEKLPFVKKPTVAQKKVELFGLIEAERKTAASLRPSKAEIKLRRKTEFEKSFLKFGGIPKKEQSIKERRTAFFTQIEAERGFAAELRPKFKPKPARAKTLEETQRDFLQLKRRTLKRPARPRRRKVSQTRKFIQTLQPDTRIVGVGTVQFQKPLSIPGSFTALSKDLPRVRRTPLELLFDKEIGGFAPVVSEPAKVGLFSTPKKSLFETPKATAFEKQLRTSVGIEVAGRKRFTDTLGFNIFQRGKDKTRQPVKGAERVSPITSFETTPKEGFINLVKPISISTIRRKEIVSEKEVEKEILIEKEIERLNILPSQRYGISQTSFTAPREIVKEFEKLKEKEKISRVPLIPFTAFKKPKQTESFGYQVFVRGKGKKTAKGFKSGEFIQATKGVLSRKEALAFGQSLVATTAKRTFKLVPTVGRRAKVGRIPKFRPEMFRTKGRTFIEKSRFALDTSGEKEEITAKGIATLKGFGLTSFTKVRKRTIKRKKPKKKPKKKKRKRR